MYDLPAVRWATDALWTALAAALAGRGVEAPGELDRRSDYPAVWREPGLVLSQTCGYPYAAALRGRVQLVATPVYAAPGCDGPRYCSLIVVRADDPARALADLRGRRVAFNATDSQSGYNALRAAVAPLAVAGRFFGGRLITGSHAASVRAVASGSADLCAIDCVTWALFRRHQQDAVAGLRVIGQTERAPSLPLITGLETPVATVREALGVVLTDPGLEAARDALLLRGMEVLPDHAYDVIQAMENGALAVGYRSLD